MYYPGPLPNKKLCCVGDITISLSQFHYIMNVCTLYRNLALKTIIIKINFSHYHSQNSSLSPRASAMVFSGSWWQLGQTLSAGWRWWLAAGVFSENSKCPYFHDDQGRSGHQATVCEDCTYQHCTHTCPMTYKHAQCFNDLSSFMCSLLILLIIHVHGNHHVSLQNSPINTMSCETAISDYILHVHVYDYVYQPNTCIIKINLKKSPL